VNLMLVVLTLCTLVGAFAPQMGPRQSRVLVAIAIAFAVVYFVHPAYMT
jgi:hypothetical protein